MQSCYDIIIQVFLKVNLLLYDVPSKMTVSYKKNPFDHGPKYLTKGTLTQNYKWFAASKLAKEATCLKLLIDMRTTYNLLVSIRLERKPNISYFFHEVMGIP